jgi:hypothetical protein
MERKTKRLNFTGSRPHYSHWRRFISIFFMYINLAVSRTLQTDPTPPYKYFYRLHMIKLFRPAVLKGLRNRWIGFLCPAGIRDIFLIHKKQAGSGVHPASYEAILWGYASTGGKAAGPWSCHLHPSSPRPSVGVAILPLSHTCSPRLITHGDFTLLTHYDMGVQTGAREVVLWGPRPHL